jgi:predicted DNA-binding transcriptional regulator AlpA
MKVIPMKEAQNKLILNRQDIKAMGITVSNVTLLRWEQMGRFPKRIRMAGKHVGWLAVECQQWLQDRATERAHHVYTDLR